MTTEQTFSKREFVYCGVRIDGKAKRFVEIRFIDDAGQLGKAMHFGWKKANERCVGNVYSCELSDDGGTVKGLSVAPWLRTWPNESDRIQWAALESQANFEVKRHKMETEAGKASDIERIMLPLRKTYQDAMTRLDMSTCRALEAVVLEALRTRIRASEKK